MQYDLLTLGLRLRDLGTPLLWWDELRAVIVCAPEGSAIIRAQAGENARWGLAEQLLAATTNAVRFMSWQLAGDSNAAKPKQILPPGANDSSRDNVTRGDVMSIEEMDRRLAAYR